MTESKALLTICNIRGLHARAASKFVKLVSEFDAEVKVRKIHESEYDEEPANGTSILGLMSLAAEPGSRIEVAASGAQAAEVVTAISELVNSRFGEAE